MEVASTVKAHEGEPRASNEDFDKTDKSFVSKLRISIIIR